MGKFKGIERNLPEHGDREFSRYMRRAFLASSGFDHEDLGRPIIGIADTSSDYNTCHRDMAQIIKALERGVLEAGGLPLVFTTSSWNEILTAPTTMLYRNLLAMETEELIRAQPMDAVILLGGCDKTVPAQLMAAVSADIPALAVVCGPMRTSYWQGQRLGACTDCRRLWAAFRAGEIDQAGIAAVEQRLCASGGTCAVMGTASTMACMCEALGMMLPGGASPPSASAERLRHAVESGRRAVVLARDDLRPSKILSASSFSNAVRVLVALGGSTNAVIHLCAIAGRAGIELALEDFDRIAVQTPLLVDCKPSGKGYMEDFHAAGGMPALLKALSAKLELDAFSVSGCSLAGLLAGAEEPGDWQSVIRSCDAPLGPCGSLRVLEGSLAPDGAVIKAAAASPELFKHRGPAVVFDSPADAAARIDDPALGLGPHHVLVLRNAGPVAAAMPEAASLPIPAYLATQGVKDMVRVSDGRMSGTAYGTIALHCSPEAAVGGPLGLLHDGDIVALDIEGGRLDVELSDSEIACRREQWVAPPLPARGWQRIYCAHVLQAHRGADLDLLLP